MNSTNTTDLLIVGGGVLGAFFAYHALERGFNVILLERNATPRGATVRNFGQVVPSGLDNHWQRYGRESLEIYRSIQSSFDISVRQHGSVYLASNEEELTLIRELHEINGLNDYPSELWSPKQCQEKYPHLRNDYCVGGLHFPDELSVNPRLMVHRLHNLLSQNDRYRYKSQTTVHDLSVTQNGLVKASTNEGQEYFASNAIVCSGSEFQTLFPQRFLESDLTAVKLQMLRLRPQQKTNIPGNVLTGLSIRRYESFSQCPSWKEIKSNEAEESFAKRFGIHILFKQEVDGSIILGDSHEYASVKDFDSLDFELKDEINEFMLEEAQKIMDLPSWEIENSWAGVYCQTKHPSGIYTQAIDKPIHIVTGIGGKGMTSSAGFTKEYLKVVYDD